MTESAPEAPRPEPPWVAEADHAEHTVAAALAQLERLDERPVAEHVPAYETVHRTLQDTLAAVDGG